MVFQASNGSWEGHDYCVTVVVERYGLNELDVVMDFRDLETELIKILDPMRGHTLNELEMSEPLDIAKRIAQHIIPKLPHPVVLESISLQDGNGRRITLQP